MDWLLLLNGLSLVAMTASIVLAASLWYTKHDVGHLGRILTILGAISVIYMFFVFRWAFNTPAESDALLILGIIRVAFTVAFILLAYYLHRSKYLVYFLLLYLPLLGVLSFGISEISAMLILASFSLQAIASFDIMAGSKGKLRAASFCALAATFIGVVFTGLMFLAHGQKAWQIAQVI